MAGNDKLAQSCISKGAHQDLIAGGYALKKDHKKVNSFLQNDPSCATEIAKNYVICKRRQTRRRISQRTSCRCECCCKNICNGCDLKKAELYQTKYQASPDKIAQGLVMGGYFKEAREFHKKHPETMNGILTGLAAAGHLKEIDYYRSLPNFNENNVTKVLAYNNHHDAVKKFSADPLYIAEGYALGGNIKKLAEVLIDNNMDVKKEYVIKFIILEDIEIQMGFMLI